jgi:hypothetical protein
MAGRLRSWPDVLTGAASYFTYGGRYHRVHQKTVYAALDPLVSITEYAFHDAISLQELVGGGPLSAPPRSSRLDPPLVSRHLLWCFTLSDAAQLVDVEDLVALQTFQHRPYELVNPTPDAYHRTTSLADLVRQYGISHHPTPGGILAPSVRTPSSPGYTPRQHVFFVPHDALALSGAQVRRWTLTIEFRDTVGRSVTPQTRDIEWSRPWIRLGGARQAVPAYAHRPDSHPLKPGTWYQIEIKFA